ncbi:hypothetical protein AYO20_06241 [Fonsecaea nubica]|uniref:Apple domain-containing protein n=1 Tax=Fonsecaea nubica TaxID=856822 RepID=A0A178CX20_9EURO|nr:hypothetical protein AYO20_06241 [Fonsecaea nubica]OAL34398.1 hypothetical protein AYO20_06241 [Fonsecaea nubica]
MAFAWAVLPLLLPALAFDIARPDCTTSTTSLTSLDGGIGATSSSLTTTMTTSTITSMSTTLTPTSTTLSTSTTSSAAVSPTSDCMASAIYQSDEYCGCSYFMECGFRPTYSEGTILVGISGLDGVTQNHAEYCADQCDVDYLCLSVLIDIQGQRCYLYNELPEDGIADVNYDTVQRANLGPDSCVNDSTGVCLANEPLGRGRRR